MEPIPMPTQGDYDPAFISICLITYLIIVMLLLHHAVAYCVAPEPDLEIGVYRDIDEKSPLDVAYTSSLMMYEDVANGPPPNYCETSYGSIRLVVTDRS